MMFKNCLSPLNQIFRALSLWLFRDPYFKVLVAIVIALAVLVVYVFKILQSAPKLLLHHVAMLKLIFPVAPDNSVSLRSNKSSSELLVGHAFVGAISGAMLLLFVASNFEFSVTSRAFSFFGVTIFLCLVLTSFRAKLSPVRVGRLALIWHLASKAVQRDRARTNGSPLNFVYSSGHFLPLSRTEIGIVPKGMLANNPMPNYLMGEA